MKTWEYSHLTIDTKYNELVEQLDGMGSAGWELITCKIWSERYEVYECIFKRPK